MENRRKPTQNHEKHLQNLGKRSKKGLSTRQFLWSALLLMLAIYVMAVYVTQAATAYRLESRDGAYASEIQRWWGSMRRGGKRMGNQGEIKGNA